MKYNKSFLTCKIFLAVFTSSLQAAPVEPAFQSQKNSTTQSAFQNHTEWFAAFLKNTDQKANLKKVILQSLQENFPHIWKRIEDPHYTFISAFVGVGTGGIEIPLLQEYAKTRGTQHNFKTFCEDPSPQMKEEFFTAATIGGIEEQVMEYSLSSFEDSSYTPPQADFALASHVWYYIKSWRQVEEPDNSLAKFAHILSGRSGVGMIALQSNTSDRYTLISDYESAVGLPAELGGEEIAAELDRLGIHHKVKIVESHLNMESCFEQGHFQPNEEGKNILSFLLRAPWDNLSPDIQERAKRILLSQVQANGKNELILRDCHIWISPSTESNTHRCH